MLMLQTTSPASAYSSTRELNTLSARDSTHSRYANSRHAYQWPRVTAMIGDGKTKYDHDHDNEANEAAACSVSVF